MSRAASRAVATSLLAVLWVLPVAARPLPAVPIPEDPRDREAVEAFIGKPAVPKRLHSFDVPRHPFMAPNDRSNIHDDAYQTDAAAWAGPLGRDPRAISTFHVAECASLAFDARDRIVSICVGLEGPRVVMMDPETLETLAVHPLPPRGVGGTGSSPFNDFSGGGYFYLDHKDRVVAPTSTRAIWVVGQTETPEGPAFELVQRYDLSSAVPPGEGIVSALPDWDGLLWFVGTRGVVGTVDPENGTVRSVRLEGEAIANSFAVDEDGGVYIVSDHALYRFDANEKGAPKITWRERYDRGERIKPGQVSQGSGTTPTLIGRDHIAITDNAEPRMHVIVYKRAERTEGDRMVCLEPVFRNGRSATDNTLIAVGNSLIVENNYGYSGPMATTEGASTTPGLARIDFGRGGCRTAWTSKETAPSVVPKASLATGLVYTYTKDEREDGIDAWYLTALDFHTGKTVYRVLNGTGLGFNNNYAPITIGPDGSAYVGVLGGLTRLHDTR